MGLISRGKGDVCAVHSHTRIREFMETREREEQKVVAVDVTVVVVCREELGRNLVPKIVRLDSRKIGLFLFFLSLSLF